MSSPRCFRCTMQSVSCLVTREMLWTDRIQWQVLVTKSPLEWQVGDKNWPLVPTGKYSKNLLLNPTIDSYVWFVSQHLDKEEPLLVYFAGHGCTGSEEAYKRLIPLLSTPTDWLTDAEFTQQCTYAGTNGIRLCNRPFLRLIIGNLHVYFVISR